MFGPTSILIAIIIIAVVLIGLLIIKPSITVSRGGKVLAFVSLLVFPVLGGSMGVSEHIERSKSTEFCTSCHVMKDYGKSLLIDDASYIPAGHFQNNRVPRDAACYTCHTDYAMYGGFRAKLRGLRHVYAQYIGKIPDKIQLYNPYNNRECLHCHQGARSFEEGATHNMEEGRLDLMKANKLSCMSTGCHSATHDVKNLPNLTFWSPDKAKKDAAGAADEVDAGSNR
jgi:cytochrome c-type protein NapC